MYGECRGNEEDKGEMAMRKVIIILFFLCCLTITSSLYASAEDLEKLYFTAGALNGRAWQEMNLEKKVSFIAGFREGIGFCSTGQMNIEGVEEESIKKFQQALSVTSLSKMTTGEIVEYFDKFYSDATNRNIPIHEAYTTLILRYSGLATEEKFSDVIQVLRKKYNK